MIGMKNYEIKNAMAEYTGGGIYCYYGQFNDGTWFKGSDNWESISVCDADTSTEDSDFEEFYEVHLLHEIEGEQYKHLFNKILKWIIDNAPKGNYQAWELESRFLQTELQARMFDCLDYQSLFLMGNKVNIIFGDGSERLAESVDDIANLDGLAMFEVVED